MCDKGCPKPEDYVCGIGNVPDNEACAETSTNWDIAGDLIPDTPPSHALATSGNVRIDFLAESSGNLYITDMEGKIIESFNIKKLPFINVTLESSGVFFVKFIKDDSTVLNKKIIVIQH